MKSQISLMKEINLNISQTPISYSVLIEEGLLSKFYQYIKNLKQYNNLVVIHDSNINKE